MRIGNCSILLAITLFCTGCKTLSERSVDHDFPGIQSAMDKPIVCLLFVHGIGGYSNDDPKHILDSIAKMPNMRVTAANHDVELGDSGGTLKREDFVNTADGHELRAYTLEWEPVTVDLKNQYLGYDQESDITSKRLPINNELRKELLDGGIPDVVLYVGQYKSAIQRTVKQALRQMHSDIETRADKRMDYEFVFVTWSLGSKIVFDCLADPHITTTQPSGPTTQAIADDYTFNKIAEKTHSVFMLANQLPLLTLGDVKSPVPSRAPAPKPYQSLLSVAKRRKAATTHPSTNAPPAAAKLSIVAFSDPNDLLSYPIPPWLEANDEASFANVSISEATTAYYIPFVGWIWNPDTAHTAYGIDDHVVDMILNGAKVDGVQMR
jgi:hypothetical protein